MARVPFGLRATANRGPLPAAATSPSMDLNLGESLSRPKKTTEDARPLDKGKKRATLETPPVVGTSKKLKGLATEESSNTVSSTFGSIAAEHFSEGDAEKLRSRNLDEGQAIFISSLGEAFYHGLQSFSHQNNVIKDQEKYIKKLKGENRAVGEKFEVLSKRAEEEVKAKDAEIAKLQATLEAERREHIAAIESVKAEASKARSEWEAVRKQEQDDLYTEGFLDYLANFLAVDPDYSWKGFPPSTPNFVAGFKEKHGDLIEKSKEAMRKQTEVENAELAKAAGGDTSMQNVGDASAQNVGDASVQKVGDASVQKVGDAVDGHQGNLVP